MAKTDRFVTSYMVASILIEKANSNYTLTFNEEVDVQGTKENCNTIEVRSTTATNNSIF
jgi:hypothetical protein